MLFAALTLLRVGQSAPQTFQTLVLLPGRANPIAILIKLVIISDVRLVQHSQVEHHSQASELAGPPSGSASATNHRRFHPSKQEMDVAEANAVGNARLSFTTLSRFDFTENFSFLSSLLEMRIWHNYECSKLATDITGRRSMSFSPSERTYLLLQLRGFFCIQNMSEFAF